MKYLKPWWSDGGGFLHLTILLSLAGLRVDLDVYLLLTPPTLLRNELQLLGCPGSSAYALSPFLLSGGWGRAGQLHPKSQELDLVTLTEGQLLREVRALGVPFIPRTRVDAWLVHNVAAGDANGAQGLLSAAASASSAGGIGASVDGNSQAAPESGGDPRVARSGHLLAASEEEKSPAELSSGIPCASERYLDGTDTSFCLEDLFHLLSSQPEHPLEGISLGDIPLLPGGSSDGMSSSAHYHINFSQAISQDVNLREAILLCPNNTFRRDPVARTSQPQEPFPPLHPPAISPEQTFSVTNWTGCLSSVDSQMRNLTGQDHLYDLDVNGFDEINLMSLVMGGFDPGEVSQLFEEPDSDSGLSLNSSHCSISATKSNSSHSGYDEEGGVVGSSSDLEISSHHDLEGAVGGYSPESSNLFHMDHRNESGFHAEVAFEHIFHNHTYHLQPTAPESTSKSFLWPGEPQKSSRLLSDTDRNLTRDERRAKALHIPFSVDEIVHMPADSFNRMLSRYYLTDLQVSLIRDIRRRGKNKVAAQNCRKRKLDVILNLEGDVCNLQAKKETLQREQAQYNKAINIMKQKLHDLYHDVFDRLRDDRGRPVNPNQYALQCCHNGSVLIVPKEFVMSGHKKENQKGKSERN